MKAKKKQVKKSVISLTDKSKVKNLKPKRDASATLTATGPEMIQQIDISLFIPTPDNKRVIDEKTESFKDLLASVKAEGVKFAVIARPHPDKPGKLDLRAGARRLRAAQLAGLKTIPAIVRQMTDIEAINITYLENLRENLTAMQEAELIAEMLDKHGGDYQAVAMGLGKPAHWVAMRANVGDNLAVDWVEELKDSDSPFVRWSIGHLELIARFDTDRQVQLLEQMKEDSYLYDDISVAGLRARLEQQMQVLDKANWGMDETLDHVAADGLPVCSKCAKRSGHKPMLFSEMTGKDKGERCLDAQCWAKKEHAAKCRDISKAKQKYPDLVLIGERHRISKEDKTFGDVQAKYDFVPAKKTDARAVAVIDIHPANPNYPVKFMKPRHAEQEPDTISGKPAKTQADKAQALLSKRWNYILKALRKKLHTTTLDMIAPEDKTSAVLVLVSEYSTSSSDRVLNMEPIDALKAEHFHATEQYRRVLEGVWEQVRDKIDSAMAYNGPITQVPDEKIETGKFVAWLIRDDLELLMHAAMQEHPTPRAWGKQATAKVVSGESMTKENNPVEDSEDESDDEEN